MVSFFTKVAKKYPKIYMEPENNPDNQRKKEILGKNNKAGGIILLDFKTHYKAIVIKNSMVLV